MFRWVHVLAGSVALLSFWIPLVTRKGGPGHRRAGWVYAVAMWVAALAAWGMCGMRLYAAGPGNDNAAWFLAFVGLLSANGAATGIRVLRTRKAVQGVRAVDAISSVVLLAAALALGVMGMRSGSILHVAFGVLGAFLASRQLRYWLQGSSSKMQWWYLHMGNMIVACIGTVTAFLVVNVTRFGLETYGLYLWFGPGILGGVGSAIWIRAYRRKFETAQ